MPASGIKAFMLMSRVKLINVHLMFAAMEKAGDHDPAGMTSCIARQKVKSVRPWNYQL